MTSHVSPPALGDTLIDGRSLGYEHYERFHRRRIGQTIAHAKRMGGGKVLEIGSHPWVMTSALVDEDGIEVVAAISAEEATQWPDDIGVTRTQTELRTRRGRQVAIPTYSANIERTRFAVQERPDMVLACEIMEHLVRAPHVMLLNVNSWLPVGGKLLVTTPNGAQFNNPFRLRTATPHYRAALYERHSYLYTMPGLVDLIELCGFRVLESEYWEVYERAGLSRLLGWLGRVPSSYFEQKFMKTLVVSAEKREDVETLPRCPQVYDARGRWEFIASPAEPR